MVLLKPMAVVSDEPAIRIVIAEKQKAKRFLCLQ